MRRFSHRRRRASWGYADFTNLQVSADPANVQAAGFFILPPGRAQYLMEAGRKDRLTVKTIHMWLDFRWVCFAGSFTNPQQIPDVELYVRKGTSRHDDVTPDMETSGALVSSPFAAPTVPSQVTTWAEAPADDGTDSFMWCHAIKGMSPPNGVVAAVTISPPTAPNTYGYGNQYGYMFRENDGQGDLMLCRTFSVRAEWQPDVIIRSARRLQKGEGIMLGMNVYTVAGQGHIAAQLDVRSRVLVA